MQGEGLTLCFALSRPGSDPACVLLVGIEVPLHRGEASRRQLVIYKGVEICLGDRRLGHAHFTLHCAVAATSLKLSRSVSRASDNCNITVLTGTPSTRAVSA